MNSIYDVENVINAKLKLGAPLSDVAWAAALACVGWPYVFGAWGDECTPKNREKFFRSQGAEHPTIKTACQAINNGKTCGGCKWYPKEERTLFFDCRGFTYWILQEVYGWELKGGGATSQWNTKENWKAQGPISTMPKDTLCCVFVANGNKKSHTGLALNGETVECSAGVQHKKLDKRWTHWAVPACVEGEVTPEPEPEEPTLRKGAKGERVRELQEKLLALGYQLPRYGADGDYGAETIAAVKEFQKDHGLTADGVCGPKTWAALKKAEEPKKVTYTVTIPGLDRNEADELLKKYDKATAEAVEG